MKPEISIVLPCRNEEKAIGFCLESIKKVIKENKLKAEIIVSDSSRDNSSAIAKKLGAKVVKHDKEGYGIACIEGFKAAKGKYIFMADADATYDFKNIPRFVEYLKQGYDFVIGNRFKGRIEKMPFMHRYVGNPLLSAALRLFFKAKIKDAHCGMRAITKEAFEKLDLRTLGMEFASEMVIKAVKMRLKIKQIPINYYKRKGMSKLRTFSDGWKHMRFMLLYSPLWLFLIPGIILLLIGIFSLSSILSFESKSYHLMFVSSLLVITGYQLMLFSLFAKTYAAIHLSERSVFNRLYRYLTIERASVIGLLIIIVGFVIYLTTLINWLSGEFDPVVETRKSVIALTIITIGIQSIFSSFMLSILGIRRN